MEVQNTVIPGASAPAQAVGAAPGNEPRIRPVGQLQGQTPPVVVKEEHEAEGKDFQKILEGMNAVLLSSGSHVRFVQHKAARQMMVQILDNDTQEVIRTIPAKELLDLAARVSEMIGLILDHKS